MALFHATYDAAADRRRTPPSRRPAPRAALRTPATRLRLRALLTFAALLLAFAVIAAQLLRLGLMGGAPRWRR